MAQRLLVVFLAPLLLCMVAHSELIRWRTPGVSGEWFSAGNWITPTGEGRVPGIGDDVEIGGYHPVYGAKTNIFIEEGEVASAKSVKIGLGICIWAAFDLYSWTGTAWPSSRVYPSFQQAQAIVLKGGELRVQQQIELASYSSGILLLKSATKASEVYAQRIFGVGDLRGSGKIHANMGNVGQIVILSSPTLTGPFSPGRLEVHGDISLASNLIAPLKVYANFSTNVKFSQLFLNGKFNRSSGGRFTLYISSSTGPMDSPAPVFLLADASEPLVFSDLFTQPARLGEVVIGMPLCEAYSPPVFVLACGRSDPGALSLLLAMPDNPQCLCPPGTYGASCQYLNCPGLPDCNNHGTCTPSATAGEPPQCVCAAGWSGSACEIPTCPGNCNGRGRCISEGVATPYCLCDEGWDSKPDCSVGLCPNDCTSPSHGSCSLLGEKPTCKCALGWTLGLAKDCSMQVVKCPGSPLQCSGRGTCHATFKNCTCNTGSGGADCSLPVCGGSPAQCSHHGACRYNALLQTSKCVCEPGWTGNDCSQPYCPNGCSGHGRCITTAEPPRCICDGPVSMTTNATFATINPIDYGWTGADCSVRVQSCSASSCVSRNGVCDAQVPNLCRVDTCRKGWTGWDCSVAICENTGAPECSGHGRCDSSSGDPVCRCRAGWLPGPKNDCSLAACEVNGCNGHGRCRTDLATPTCECDPFFYGPDCSSTVSR